MSDSHPLLNALEELLRGVIADEIRRALADHDGGRPPLLLDTNQTSKLLELPTSWVAAAARRGELPSVKLGHHVRFRLADIEAFINQRLCDRNSGTASPATAKRT